MALISAGSPVLETDDRDEMGAPHQDIQIVKRPVGPPKERARLIPRKQGKTYAANGARERARRQASEGATS